VIVSLSIAALYWIVKRQQVNPISFQTNEGRWALGVIFLAPIIMIGRTVVLYEPGAFMMFCLSGSVFAVARHLFHKADRGTKTEIALLIGSVATGLAAITSAGYLVYDIGFSYYSNTAFWSGLAVNLWGFLALSMMFELARKTEDWAISRTLNFLTALSTALLMLAYMIVDSMFHMSLGWVTIAASILILGGFAVFYVIRGWKPEALTLAIGVGAILLINIEPILSVFTQTGWWGLAAAGTTTIIGGAVIERTLSKRIEPA